MSSAEGSWNLVVDTPMGQQTGTLDLKVEGATLTGTNTAMGSSDPVINGTVDGDALTFQVKARKPLPMTLSFDLVVNGDSLSGQVAIGSFGKAKVTATRA